MYTERKGDLRLLRVPTYNCPECFSDYVSVSVAVPDDGNGGKGRAFRFSHTEYQGCPFSLTYFDRDTRMFHIVA